MDSSVFNKLTLRPLSAISGLVALVRGEWRLITATPEHLERRHAMTERNYKALCTTLILIAAGLLVAFAVIAFTGCGSTKPVQAPVQNPAVVSPDDIKNLRDSVVTLDKTMVQVSEQINKQLTIAQGVNAEGAGTVSTQFPRPDAAGLGVRQQGGSAGSGNRHDISGGGDLVRQGPGNNSGNRAGAGGAGNRPVLQVKGKGVSRLDQFIRDVVNILIGAVAISVIIGISPTLTAKVASGEHGIFVVIETIVGGIWNVFKGICGHGKAAAPKS